jgi:hypothetical protein
VTSAERTPEASGPAPGRRFPKRPQADRVQTGVRMEKRMVKALKGLAELYDVSLGELLEDMTFACFAGRLPWSEETLRKIAELARIYGLDLPPHAGEDSAA